MVRVARVCVECEESGVEYDWCIVFVRRECLNENGGVSMCKCVCVMRKRKNEHKSGRW